MTGQEMKAIRTGADLSLNELAALVRYRNTDQLRKMEAGKFDVAGPISVILELVRDGRLDDYVELVKQ